MTIRELILELRKIGNHDAVVMLDVGHPQSLQSIETQDLGTGRGPNTVYLRPYYEATGTPLSSTRRVVYGKAG
jgi:hypothetical protein